MSLMSHTFVLYLLIKILITWSRWHDGVMVRTAALV